MKRGTLWISSREKSPPAILNAMRIASFDKYDSLWISPIPKYELDLS